MNTLLSPNAYCNCPCINIDSPGRVKSFVPTIEYDGKRMHFYLDCEIHSVRYELLSARAAPLSREGHYDINLNNHCIRECPLPAAKSCHLP